MSRAWKKCETKAVQFVFENVFLFLSRAPKSSEAESGPATTDMAASTEAEGKDDDPIVEEASLRPKSKQLNIQWLAKLFRTQEVCIWSRRN